MSVSINGDKIFTLYFFQQKKMCTWDLFKTNTNAGIIINYYSNYEIFIFHIFVFSLLFIDEDDGDMRIWEQ